MLLNDVGQALSMERSMKEYVIRRLNMRNVDACDRTLFRLALDEHGVLCDLNPAIRKACMDELLIGRPSLSVDTIVPRYEHIYQATVVQWEPIEEPWVKLMQCSVANSFQISKHSICAFVFKIKQTPQAYSSRFRCCACET